MGLDEQCNLRVRSRAPYCIANYGTLPVVSLISLRANVRVAWQDRVVLIRTVIIGESHVCKRSTISEYGTSTIEDLAGRSYTTKFPSLLVAA